MGVERTRGVEVLLGQLDGVVERHRELVGHPLDARLGASGQRPAERVARARVTRPATCVAVAVGQRAHRLWSSSSSQCTISADTTLGASSCRKCPTSSTIRQLYGPPTYRPEPAAVRVKTQVS